MPFTARAADPLADVDSQSAGGAAALARAIESIHPSDERRVLALFDHDGEGVKRFNALSKHFKRVEGKSHVRRHVNGFALAATLGSLRERCEYAAASNLSIEFLFPDEALQFTTRSGAGLVLEDFCGSALVQGGRQMQLSENQAEKVAQALGIFPHYRRIVSGKRVFAERVVPRLASEQFSSFRTLFEAACQILGVPSPATQGASLQ